MMVAYVWPAPGVAQMQRIPDLKAYGAGVASILAGFVAFVQSDRWEVALLVLISVAAMVGLGLMVHTRLEAQEHEISAVRTEVQHCREGHKNCDERLARANTAIAILHTTLKQHDPHLPRLSDLIGDDAPEALQEALNVRRDAKERKG